VFRSLLVENPLRFLVSPILGALGGLAAWALYALAMALYADSAGGPRSDIPLIFQRTAYFGLTGLGVGFSCNMLRVIQDGQGPARVFGAGLLSGLIAGAGGVVGGLILHLLIELEVAQLGDVGPRLLCYLLVGMLVGLSSRITLLDRSTLYGGLGGLLGGGFAVGLWLALDRWAGASEAYAAFLIPMSLGSGIGLLTYSLPSFISGGSLRVLTGQFKGQTKAIESRSIVVGNNKRQLQWVLPKWEGIQDPHAKIEVQAEARGFTHSVRNLSTKAVVVLRDGKRNRIREERIFALEDGDVIVFATGKSYVKVRYTQRTEEG
jgi:hypothetical protein